MCARVVGAATCFRAEHTFESVLGPLGCAAGFRGRTGRDKRGAFHLLQIVECTPRAPTSWGFTGRIPSHLREIGVWPKSFGAGTARPHNVAALGRGDEPSPFPAPPPVLRTTQRRMTRNTRRAAPPFRTPAFQAAPMLVSAWFQKILVRPQPIESFAGSGGMNQHAKAQPE